MIRVLAHINKLCYNLYMKLCSNCNTEKPLEEFHKNKSSKDGHSHRCKDCAKAITRLWYKKNKERDHQNSKRWSKKNPTRRNEHKRKWLEKNPDYHRAWKKNNPEYLRIAQLKRRARKRELPSKFSVQDWHNCLTYWSNKCAVCGYCESDPNNKRILVSDHWIPLTSTDCPGTVLTNIIPLCQGKDGCNNSKSDSDPEKWLTIKFGIENAHNKLREIQDYFDTLNQ